MMTPPPSPLPTLLTSRRTTTTRGSPSWLPTFALVVSIALSVACCSARRPSSLLVAAIDTQGNGNDIAFTVDQKMHNSKLQTSYNNKMEKYNTLREKACGDIMKFITLSQHVHVKGLEGNAPGMWAALIAVHLQQAPGT
jgi:hypothetical protein